LLIISQISIDRWPDIIVGAIPGNAVDGLPEMSPV